MTNTVIANGNTYTDDDDPVTGQGDGGFQTRLLPMLSDVMHDTNAALTTTTGNAAAAAASAASALAAPGTSGTSGTTLTIGTGTTYMVTQQAKSFVVGASIKWASTASPSNWGHGDITAYDPSTGLITINTTRIQGSGTAAAWTLSLSGPAYADGAIGGAATGVMTTDLALSASSPKLTAVAAALAGLSIIQPDATTLPQGPFQQQIKHGGFTSSNRLGFDLQIKDHSGALMGFLQPFTTATGSLIDNTTAAGQWAMSGLQPVGTLALGKVTLASAVGGTGGVWNRNLQLDATHTLILLYGTSLHAVVYDATAKSFGAPVLLRATLSTTGVDATVAMALVSAGVVMVQSVQDGTTAMQSVVLTISGTTISPGAVVSTTLGAVCNRIVDLVTVGSAFVLGYLSGTTSVHTLATTISGTTPSPGAEQVNTTVGPPALIVWSATVFTVVTISTTAVTAKAYSVATNVQTAGSSATTACTTTDSFAVQLLGSGNYAASCINSNVAKGSVLQVTGTVPAFSTQVSLSSQVTTINAGGFESATGYNSNCATAVSGTDSSGRFVTEFFCYFDNGTGAATLPTGLSPVAKGFAAAQVVVPIANNSNQNWWQVTSAKELAVFGFSLPIATLFNLTGEYRTNAIGTIGQALSGPDPLYPKLNSARNSLGAYNATQSTGFVGIADGGKLSVHYGADPEGYVELLSKPISVVADMRFCSKGSSDTSAWVVFSQAPDKVAFIQQVGVA